MHHYLAHRLIHTPSEDEQAQLSEVQILQEHHRNWQFVWRAPLAGDLHQKPGEKTERFPACSHKLVLNLKHFRQRALKGNKKKKQKTKNTALRTLTTQILQLIFWCNSCFINHAWSHRKTRLSVPSCYADLTSPILQHNY